MGVLLEFARRGLADYMGGFSHPLVKDILGRAIDLRYERQKQNLPPDGMGLMNVSAAEYEKWVEVFHVPMACGIALRVVATN